MPFVVNLVVVALIWKVMPIDKVGFINPMFELVGLQGRSWLGDPNLALGAILVVTIWFLMGYYMMLFGRFYSTERPGTSMVLGITCGITFVIFKGEFCVNCS
jgi:hypothetical protein